MKIGLYSFGTSGDIHPFLALAHGLKSAGHEATLTFHCAEKKDYSPLAESLGVPYRQTNIALDTEVARINGEMARGRPLDAVKYFEYAVYPYIEEMYASAKELCRENDVVVGHPAIPVLFSAAEKTGRPRALLAVYPNIVASRYYPMTGLPSLGRRINRLLWDLGDYAYTKLFYAQFNDMRVKDGLPPVRKAFAETATPKNTPVIMAVDPQLCPPAPDWTEDGRDVQVCGFFTMPAEHDSWAMPEEMRRFLGAGPPPVFMNFGTFTSATHPVDNLQLFVAAAQHANCRAIVQVEPDMLAAADMASHPNIHAFSGRVPHHDIFPHCALVVHHGGSGTSHSTLYAGRPAVVVTHAGDQPFWAKRLELLGVADKELPRRSVTANELGGAIRRVLDSPTIIEKAREVGERMRREDGVQRAVALLEDRFGYAR